MRVPWLLAGAILLSFAAPQQARADPPQQPAPCSLGKAAADQVIEECTTLIGSPDTEKARLADAYTTRGLAYGRKEDYDRAITDFDKALELDPNQVYAYAGRGFAYQFKKEYEKAIADFSEAIRLNPNYVLAYVSRCRQRAVFLRKELTLARQDCEAALRLDPKQADALSLLGVVELRQAHFKEAWADYDTALQYKPEDALTLYGRGLASRGLGRLDAAKSDFAKAEAVEPKAAAIYAEMGLGPRRHASSRAEQ